MAAKNPIRGDFSGSDLVGLAEFQASDFIAISDGGTGAITASGARTAFGLAIGSDIQAYDAQLADIAGLTPTDSGFHCRRWYKLCCRNSNNCESIF